MAKIKVGVNGYGVIGKRIADAVNFQEDMKLIGVTARTPDFRLIPAQQKDIAVYGINQEREEKLQSAGITTNGSLANLLEKVNVIIDATPKGIGAQNKEVYEQQNVKSIFQGGEDHQLTGLSFVAQVNYQQALNEPSVRVVSCNTTAICRMLSGFAARNLISSVFAVIDRRGADPIDADTEGPLGTVNVGKIPSHHQKDVGTIFPDIKITSVAQEVPTTLGHLHTLKITLTEELSRDEVIKILDSTSRIIPVNYQDGITSENHVVELIKDLGNPRADMWEVAYWADTLLLDEKELIIQYQVHNEAIVIPENIDAVRAITGAQTNPAASMQKTDKFLSITL